MQYYRITIIKMNGLKMSGIREYEDELSRFEIERQVWAKAIAALGTLAISKIIFRELPATDPDVGKYIMES